MSSFFFIPIFNVKDWFYMQVWKVNYNSCCWWKYSTAAAVPPALSQAELGAVKLLSTLPSSLLPKVKKQKSQLKYMGNQTPAGWGAQWSQFPANSCRIRLLCRQTVIIWAAMLSEQVYIFSKNLIVTQKRQLLIWEVAPTTARSS